MSVCARFVGTCDWLSQPSQPSRAGGSSYQLASKIPRLRLDSVSKYKTYACRMFNDQVQVQNAKALCCGTLSVSVPLALFRRIAFGAGKYCDVNTSTLCALCNVFNPEMG